MNIINSKNYIASFILVTLLHVTCSDSPETKLPALISEKPTTQKQFVIVMMMV